MQNSFYSREELNVLGFALYGEDVLISRKASFYGCERIVIGNHVRIDDFCILSGRVEIGDYIHISAYTGLYGGTEGIIISDYVTVSSRCAIYAETDDYLGTCMTNPMVPPQYRQTIKSKVVMDKHVIIGTGTTVLPGVHLSQGASIGAMSLVNHDIDEWTLNYGVPCVFHKERLRNPLKMEQIIRKEGKMNE